MRFKHFFFTPGVHFDRLKNETSLGILIMLAGGLLVAGSADKRPAGTTDPSAGQSLIRKDLLLKPRPVEVRPRRNIFVRGGGAVAQPWPAANVVPPQAATPSDKAVAESAGPDIRYIGFVTTAQKIVGLVLVNGQALAVAEGDRVAGDYTVLKISPETLELAGPDGQTITVSIKGENI
jgi:hypothetical protein